LGLFIARFYTPKPSEDQAAKEDQASSA
jgi:hypothetical protein